jgi:acyl-CoA thioester hydrolase
LPVVEAICRYRAPARYDDAIFVETTLLNLRSSVIKFGYRILKSVEGAAPKLLAEGETVHVFVDRQMQRTALPEKYANPLKAARTETDSSQYRDIEANGNAVHSLL